MFPKRLEVKKRWIVAIKRLQAVGSDELWQPTPTSVVCYQHFLPSDYNLISYHGLPYQRKFLRKEAVPSKFPWTWSTKTSASHMTTPIELPKVQDECELGSIEYATQAGALPADLPSIERFQKNEEWCKKLAESLQRQNPTTKLFKFHSHLQDHSNDEAYGQIREGGKLKLRKNAVSTKFQHCLPKFQCKSPSHNSKCTIVGPESSTQSFVVLRDHSYSSTVPYSAKGKSRCKSKRKKIFLDSVVNCSSVTSFIAHEESLPVDTVRVKSEPLEPTDDETEETVKKFHFQENWLSYELKTEIKEEPSSPTHTDYLFCT
ncbi:hypothetical protein GQR58_008949 [Nymphon striatum]|nr:hypothetical protein GQR58_008949 [Nymphon striatum]